MQQGEETIPEAGTDCSAEGGMVGGWYSSYRGTGVWSDVFQISGSWILERSQPGGHTVEGGGAIKDSQGGLVFARRINLSYQVFPPKKSPCRYVLEPEPVLSQFFQTTKNNKNLRLLLLFFTMNHFRWVYVCRSCGWGWRWWWLILDTCKGDLKDPEALG